MTGIKINVETTSIDVATAFAEHAEEQIEAGNMECPAEDCNSRAFDVEIWETQNGYLQGEAICHECESTVELNMDNDSIQKVQKAFDDFEKSLKRLGK